MTKKEFGSLYETVTRGDYLTLPTRGCPSLMAFVWNNILQTIPDHHLHSLFGYLLLRLDRI